MRSARTIGVVAVSAAVAVALAVPGAASASLPATAAEATVPAVQGLPPVTPATAGGWLLLETGATDAVRYDRDRDAATGDPTQVLGSAGCALSTSETLLRIDGYVGSGATDQASFASDSLGVAEKKTGVSCYQVDAGTRERLDLTLALGRPVASSAFLDLELKQGARVLAVAALKGTPVGWYDLQSGGNVGTPLPAGLLPAGRSAVAFACQPNADSGPDAAVGDNCRWPISTPSWTGADDGVFFDSLSLRAVSGSFSVEGGSDGLVPTAAGLTPPAGFPQRASFLELADGLLDCGGSTETLPALGDSPLVRVRRLGSNAEVGGVVEACRGVPYSLRNGSLFAQFLKPLGDQLGAQFVLEMSWRVPGNSTTTALPATTIDYESGASAEFPLEQVPLGWCPDAIVTDLTLEGIRRPSAAPDQDELPGTQFACLGVQQAVAVDADPDWVRVAEQIYLLGDAFYRK